MTGYQHIKTIGLASIGFALRITANHHFGQTLQDRVEISTPINSWKRAFEAVHLWKLGLNPYGGGLFHEYPLSLIFYNFIATYLNTNFIFAFIDVLTAILLQKSIHDIIIHDDKDDHSSAHKRSNYVFLAYLFSPLAILSCSGLATTTFTNFLIALILFVLSRRISSKFIVCGLAALLSCDKMHFATLVGPIFLCSEYLLSKRDGSAIVSPYYVSEKFRSSITEYILTFFASICLLVTISYFSIGSSWSFINSTYWFALKVDDLTPNIGMFWYFFTEVFENFLDFFTWIFQINAFIHILPLCIHFKDDPKFGFYISLLTSTIFQPYPSLSNIALVFSLTFQWMNLFDHLRRGLVVCSACVVCITLWPIFWHQWIVTGTGNANFYFGATLAFVTSLILFTVDICQAYKIKSETDLAKKAIN